MERNVVLVVLDTVRKDFFDGFATALTARADATFERCYAAAHYTLPSHASMLTGTLPHEHGVHSRSPDYSQIPFEDTFLADLDCARIGVSANGGFLSEDVGFDAFFDTFCSFQGRTVRYPSGIDPTDFHDTCDRTGVDRIREYVGRAYRDETVAESLGNAIVTKLNEAVSGTPIPRLTDYGAKATTKTAIESVDGREPFFLFLNYIDAHGPFDAVLGWDNDVPNTWSSSNEDSWEIANASNPAAEYETCLDRYRRLYANAVSHLDEQVAELIDAIDRRTERETTYVITADHGEELGLWGERGFGHRDLATPILHVPLVVVNGPTVAESRPVSHLDLGRLIAALANDSTIPDLGRERVPAEKFGHIKTPNENAEYWDRICRAVYEDDIKLEWDSLGNRSKYEVSVSSERRVATDVTIPDRALRLFKGSIDDLTRAHSKGVQEPEDEQVRNRLQDLGYL